MYDEQVEGSSAGLEAPMEVDQPISVRDHDAFCAKHLTDTGEEVDDFKVFTWRVQDFRRMSKRINSPEFECGGHKWNILLFPQGNTHGEANDMVSVYLNYSDARNSQEGWHVCAQFNLAMSNPHDSTIYHEYQAYHRFNSEEQDWGFTRFAEFRKLLVPGDRARPVIEDDETEITAFVRVLKDPTGVLWHNFQNYNSKKETGYIGLKNQAATCYLNSLLQSLYFTNAYRKAVYQVPFVVETGDTLPLALQRVFYYLQTSEVPVSTTELTKAFGWNNNQSFIQYDVQEFCIKLHERMGEKLKGTPAEGIVEKLFEGCYVRTIKCINVEWEGEPKEESFNDIQLYLSPGSKTTSVEELLSQFTATEVLSGDNQYDAGPKYGYQDAKRLTYFKHFPPVLHLQLVRQSYDNLRDIATKLNERIEFSFSMDLTKFLHPDLPAETREDNWVYKLHAVLIQSGDPETGHYYAFIKPEVDGSWLRYDDDRVTRVLDRQVLEDGFGGEFNNGVDSQLGPRRNMMRPSTSAYLLVYIREKMENEILRPVSEDDIPLPRRTQLEQEKKLADARRHEQEEQHKYMNVKVITDEAFKKHQGFDLASFDERNIANSGVKCFKTLKEQSFVDFKQSIVNERNHTGDTRLWVLVNRQNKTVRPDARVPDQDPTLMMEIVRNKMASRQNDLKLYLEELEPGELELWVEKYGNEEPIMIFVKHFNVEEQTLKGLSRFYVHKHMKISDLAVMINERMNYPINSSLKIYEEIKPGMIDLMKQKLTFQQSEIQHGDILCFQTEMSEQAMDLDTTNKFTTPVQMYEFFVNRVVIQFKPRYTPSEESEPKLTDFELVLNKRMTYEAMAKYVGEYLNYDSAKLRFTTCNPKTQEPRQVVRKVYNNTLQEIITSNAYSAPVMTLFYELLEIPLLELESKTNVKVTWMGLHNKEEKTQTFLISKTSTIKELTELIAKNVTMNSDGTGSGRIRVFQNEDNRKQIVLSGNEIVRDLESLDLYAEEISMEEFNINESEEKLVGVYHYNKDSLRTHGVPFSFVIKPDEPFTETRRRLQTRLGVPDKEFTKYKFSLHHSKPYSTPSYLNDDDILHQHRWLEDDLLGVDHADRSTKKTGTEKEASILTIR